MLFFTKTHNKTYHFVTFFSISPLFVQKVRHFVKKSTFFCHGQRTNPHFQPKIKPLKNSRYTKTQLYTQKYIFLVKLFCLFTLFSTFECVFSSNTPIFNSKMLLTKIKPSPPAEPFQAAFLQFSMPHL